MTAEAGVVVKAAQDAAADAGCLFPLSFGGEGSATVGGVLSTNAGGNTTVRYGNARDLMLGLEVVLPDGQVWNGLRRLRKDNTGYALRHLFVGAEGTLGFITAAVLRLFPRPRESEVAFCAVASEDAALSLFRRFRDRDETAVRAFEYMSGAGVDLVVRHIAGASLPVETRRRALRAGGPRLLPPRCRAARGDRGGAGGGAGGGGGAGRGDRRQRGAARRPLAHPRGAPGGAAAAPALR